MRPRRRTTNQRIRHHAGFQANPDAGLPTLRWKRCNPVAKRPSRRRFYTRPFAFASDGSFGLCPFQRCRSGSLLLVRLSDAGALGVVMTRCRDTVRCRSPVRAVTLATPAPPRGDDDAVTGASRCPCLRSPSRCLPCRASHVWKSRHRRWETVTALRSLQQRVHKDGDDGPPNRLTDC